MFNFFGKPKLEIPAEEPIAEKYPELVGLLQRWKMMSGMGDSYAGDREKLDGLLARITLLISKLPEEDVERAYNEADLGKIEKQTLVQDMHWGNKSKEQPEEPALSQ
jgi:hypothetical protein